ncbi:MAG: hypothetical protein LUF87_10770 [Alistipes sp.]|nr:hypothetical protein [Alistipes sp.]
MEEKKDLSADFESRKQELLDEVNELVDNVENHSHKQHMEKKQEVEAAFGTGDGDYKDNTL